MARHRGRASPGRPISDIGRAIEEHAKAHRFGVVRAFIGHGIGEQFHADIQVLHYYDSRASMIMRPGMTFTIEPMITLGTWQHRMWDDDWTAVTADGKRTAQFEHTLLVTDDGVDVLHRRRCGCHRRRHGFVDRVKLGVFGLNSKATSGPAGTTRLARRCEELGYESWWAGEHVVLPSPRVPPAPLEPTDAILDPLVHLAFVAGASERMLLGTGIIILPQRNPLVLAKQIASLDTLSGGWFLFGVGVGYRGSRS